MNIHIIERKKEFFNPNNYRYHNPSRYPFFFEKINVDFEETKLEVRYVEDTQKPINVPEEENEQNEEEQNEENEENEEEEEENSEFIDSIFEEKTHSSENSGDDREFINKIKDAFRSQNNFFEYKENVILRSNRHTVKNMVIDEKFLNENWLETSTSDGLVNVEREKTDSVIVTIRIIPNRFKIYFQLLIMDKPRFLGHTVEDRMVKFVHKTVDVDILTISIETPNILRNMINDNCQFTKEESDSCFIIASEKINKSKKISINNFFVHPFIASDFTIRLENEDKRLIKINKLEIFLKILNTQTKNLIEEY